MPDELQGGPELPGHRHKPVEMPPVLLANNSKRGLVINKCDGCFFRCASTVVGTKRRPIAERNDHK